MSRTITNLGWAAAALMALGSSVGEAAAQGPAYIAPRPVHPVVGTTYILYEPLQPHEFLYRHYKVYRRTTGGRLTNTTRVLWW
jgi:hypothetical protein